LSFVVNKLIVGNALPHDARGNKLKFGTN